MRVSFNEEANVEINDELSLLERKGIWCSDECETLEPGDNAIDNHIDGNTRVVIDDDVESDESFKARRQRVRRFVRFVVEEYRSLKAMGIDDSISLYRISTSCSKIDAVRARERASNGTVIAKSSCCSSLLRKRLCSSRKTSPKNCIQMSSEVRGERLQTRDADDMGW